MNRVASIGGAVGLHERRQRGRAAANRQPADRTAAYGIGLRPFERPSLGRKADKARDQLLGTDRSPADSGGKFNPTKLDFDQLVVTSHTMFGGVVPVRGFEPLA